MIKNNMATLKVNLITSDYSAAIITYYNDEILEDKQFIDFLDDMLISLKVTDPFSRLIIEQKETYFLNDSSFLNGIFDIKLENQLVVFKGKKVIAYSPLEDIKKKYFLSFK